MEIKTIKFDAAGEKLWLNIDVKGIYMITYLYQMWSDKAGEQPILTNPVKQGNNISPHDDHYQIINDYSPAEPLANYDKRALDIKFWIKKSSSSNDNGYNLKVSVLQGADYSTAKEIGSDTISGILGETGLKPEGALLQLIKK